MNHPTTEIDYLLVCAQEALAEGDREAALSLLREAATAAPLRKDIKLQIAHVLQYTPEQSSAPVELNQAGTEFEDSFSNFARRAFEVANVGTQQAGAATRRLTGIVEQGLKSWSSSLAESVSSKSIRPGVSAKSETILGSEKEPITTHTEELAQYLLQEEEAAALLEDLPPADGFQDDLSPYHYEPVKPVALQQKRPARKRKAEVEDYLAAGMDRVLVQVSGIDKKTAIYTAAYCGLILFTGAACITAVRQFPNVPIFKGQNENVLRVTSPAVTSLAIGDSQLSNARILFKQGDHDQAAQLFEGALLAETSSQRREDIKAELAGVLAARGAVNLQGSRIAESVADYRKSVQLSPLNDSYQLHLGNALYYAGSFQNQDKVALQEATDVLGAIVGKSPENQHARRMLALSHAALGNKLQAKKQWEELLKLAAVGSDMHAEASKNVKSK